MPSATDRFSMGTIILLRSKHIDQCLSHSDQTSRSDVIREKANNKDCANRNQHVPSATDWSFENAWTHKLTDWLTNTSGQLFFTDPPVEIFVHRTFHAKAFERSFNTILDYRLLLTTSSFYHWLPGVTKKRHASSVIMKLCITSVYHKTLFPLFYLPYFMHLTLRGNKYN